VNLDCQEELKYLEKLLDFGADCFNQQKIDLKRIQRKKQALFAMTVAAHSITEAIYSLCKEDRSHSCFILLRTLYENFINAKFLFTSSSSKHFYVIFLDALTQKEKQLQSAVDFLHKNPQDSSVSVEMKDLNASLKKTKKLIIKTKNKINKYPGSLIVDVLGRARSVDSYNKNRGLSSASLEWIYTSPYRSLSSSTHLNYLAFPDFFKQGEDGVIEVLLSGNTKDIKFILAQANYLYLGIMNMFLSVFKNPLKTKFKKIYEGK
jgi:hypothetical protein